MHNFVDEHPEYGPIIGVMTWYHKDGPAKPYKNSDGASLMVADYVSADFGWLHSKDGKRSAWLMKPWDIIAEDYSEYKHVIVYDNAPSHLKCLEGAIFIKKMPKNILKDGCNWLIEVIKHTPDRKPVYNSDGTLQKIKIPMRDATLSNGQPQPLYFDENLDHPSIFKGMAQILIEHGYDEKVIKKKSAECIKF
ncbi:hypothetical protein C0995_002709, partial [Termitomyces sp. Mi166